MRAFAARALAAVVLTAGAVRPSAAQEADPTTFLRAMVGEWSVETEAVMGPGQDPIRTESREVARLLGTQWLVAETDAVTPTGLPHTSIRTLGWDPHDGRFVGTWIASIQTHLWSHTGVLDPSGTILTLETEGPIMGNPATTARYREVIELLGEDRRVIRSSILGPDGEWFEFARAEYRRKR